MATPYRIVWHSWDPHNPHDTIGPGCRHDWITFQRLLPPASKVYSLTHIVRVKYARWVGFSNLLGFDRETCGCCAQHNMSYGATSTRHGNALLTPNSR